MSKKRHSLKRKVLGSKKGLLFLVFAAIVWFISALSNPYTANVPVRVILESDSDKFIVLESEVAVPARVSSSGFSILFQRIFPSEISLLTSDISSIDLEKARVSSAVLLEHYKQQNSGDTNILGFVYNSFALPVSQAVQKSLPTSLLRLPRLEEGYEFASPIQFSIDTVVAMGTNDGLVGLTSAIYKLESNKILKDNFVLKASLVDSIAQLAQWSANTITVSGSVDRYSDVSFILPVVLTNAPDSLSIMLSPKEVEVKFAAPLSQLRYINAINLRAEVSFEGNSADELKVTVVGLPNSVKHLVVSPQSISYFILE